MSTAIVTSGTESGYSAEGMIALEGDAIASNSSSRIASGEIQFSAEALSTVERPLTAEGEFEFSSIAIGSVDGAPDINASAEGILSFSSLATLRNLKKKFAQGFLTFDSIATTSTTEPESAELLIVADLLPEEPAAGANIQVLGARVFIGGVEISVKSFRYSEPSQSEGINFQAELSKPYLSQVPIGTTFSFDVLKNGVWETRFNGVFGSRSYSIAFDGDQLQITSIAALADRLSKCAKRPTVYYDPIKVDQQREEASDVLTDDAGRTYPTDFEPQASLKLYTLFQWAFATICGFSSYKTNIQNFALTRADFPFGRPVLETIKALVGMFDPVVFAIGDVLWILDSTLALPSGFTPRTIGPSRYRDLSIESGPDAGNLDGLIINYTESGIGDFHTQRFVNPPATTSGEDGEPGFVETTIEQEWWDYRSSGDPTIVVRSVLKNENKETTDLNGDTIGQENLSFDFDSLGRTTGYQKTVQSLMPNPNFYGDPYQLQLVRDETQKVLMTTDSLGRTRIYERQTEIKGLVAIDSDDLYQDRSFKQDAVEAHKAGNLKAGMSSSFEPVKTTIERFTRLSNGQTSVTITTIDHLRGSVTGSTTDADAGEAQIPTRQKSRRTIVWRSTFDHLSPDVSQRKLRDLHIGELPIAVGKALAERKLARAEAGKGTGSIYLFGYDSAIRRGAVIRPLGRNGESMGDFFALGFDIVGSNLGTANASIGTSVSLLEI